MSPIPKIKNFAQDARESGRKTENEKKEELQQETPKAELHFSINEIAKMQDDYQKRTGKYISYGKMVSMIDQAHNLPTKKR